MQEITAAAEDTAAATHNADKTSLDGDMRIKSFHFCYEQTKNQTEWEITTHTHTHTTRLLKQHPFRPLLQKIAFWKGAKRVRVPTETWQPLAEPTSVISHQNRPLCAQSLNITLQLRQLALTLLFSARQNDTATTTTSQREGRGETASYFAETGPRAGRNEMRVHKCAGIANTQRESARPYRRISPAVALDELMFLKAMRWYSEFTTSHFDFKASNNSSLSSSGSSRVCGSDTSKPITLVQCS
jgi:hypothetical protein